MAAGSPMCSRCQAGIYPSWSFCSHCGSPLTPTSPSTYPVQVARTPQGQGAPPAPVPVCRNCGAAVDTSGAFCWKCGVPLATGREPFIPTHPEDSARSEAIPEEPTSDVRDVAEEAGELRAKYPGRARQPLKASIGGSLILVATALCLLSLFLAWYGIAATATASANGTTATVNANETFYPLNHYSVTLTCKGTSYCFSNTTNSGSYSQNSSDHLGQLYDAVAGIMIGGIAVGVAGGILAIITRGKSRWAATFALVALILVALGPILLLVAQPAVLNSEGGSSSGSSPRNSFFGSCSGSGCSSSVAPGETVSGSWGPSWGWYLSLASLAPLAAGFALYRGGRQRVRVSSIYDMP